MHYDWKIEFWAEETVYTHTWMAYLLFHNFQFPHYHQVVQVAFWVEVEFQAEVQPVLVEVPWFLCASSVSADSLLCHFGMEDSRQYDFYKPWPGVFRTQASPFDTRRTQCLSSSRLGLGHQVTCLVVVFPLLWCATTLLGPFWPYSRQGGCRTVLAVPDFLASQ